jgi:F0F1-type ATP synthase assembly protein I
MASMPEDPINPRELGRYFAIAQIGLEMVVPIGIGIALDHYLDWAPWGVVSGAILGLVVGLVHLVDLTKERDQNGPSKSARDSQ